MPGVRSGQKTVCGAAPSTARRAGQRPGPQVLVEQSSCPGEGSACGRPPPQTPAREDARAGVFTAVFTAASSAQTRRQAEPPTDEQTRAAGAQDGRALQSGGETPAPTAPQTRMALRARCCVREARLSHVREARGRGPPESQRGSTLGVAAAARPPIKEPTNRAFK